ncbi:glycoside hydrolase family 43 protein [Pseudomaricurvus alkylphenolicus]|uniref:glycoside hydrolase family 43 protein n=1 Tax=Pseudomaricurvus alkylphenolicus TaxID=1306991 RepID=UPI0014238818|nr:glycoside hydrolase family 43 protein [Pseudomaricurvus alkylphenolicus]NIB39951.1 glycoside hydrolase family 43 protein [Pseudomaricurvus alkylphenolicus]
MTKYITNPIIKGFNPDPSICRVGDDYYIVTSTFEWFPGYQIHHSRDLRNWQLVGRPLNRVSQLDMRGVPDSCGVWAPCLTYNDGTFYLLYTNVRSFKGDWKDMPNYLVTTNDILGEWSEPIYMNSSGFDGSLFHDDDSRCWLLNMLMDHRKGRFFGGIVMQEYDKEQQKLVGEVHYLFEGTEHGRTEGPHLYKRNGYYYLMTAEGGTGYEHCMTLARSRSITGPYDVHPENPFITSKYNPEAYLQKTGHGDLVQVQNGDWYATFLTGRPLTERGRCITGRETAIERVEWREDDWLYLACGGRAARRVVEAPDLPDHPFDAPKQRTDFDSDEIDLNFQSLRVPFSSDWVSQTQRKGYLRVVGRDSLSSCFEQSLVARRVQNHATEASTCVEFEPETFQQMAGLVCYYNTSHYYYLHITGDDFGRRAKGESVRKFLNITCCDSGRVSDALDQPIDITGADQVYLRADFNGAELQFYYALSEGDWQPVGSVLDGSILSDDYVEVSSGIFKPCFTGAFYGLCCQDLSGQRKHADFSFFEYLEHHGAED